jgi:general secretion pathway protein I
MRRVRVPARGGFTLLEVMVALAVLAGSLMAVADLSGSAMRNYVYSRDLSVATLLARGKMAELTEKYDDSGFTDFDQSEDGNFSDQGQPGMRWKLEIRKPTAELTAERILGAFLGGGEDLGAQEMLGKLMGSPGGAGGKGGPASGSPGGLLGGVMQGQVNAFAEELKKCVRQVSLRVTWKDGKVEQGFSLETYWVVLNPKAPGGARGQDPDVPANVSAPARGVPAGLSPAASPGVKKKLPGAGGTP